MNDAELDRLLARALDVAPSPDFTARVQMRIADAPRRPAPLGLAWWAVGATGAVAAAIAVVVLLPHRATPASEPTTLAASRMDLPVPTVAVAAPAGSSLQAPTTAAGPERRETARAARAPEVLVSPEDAEGLRLLVRAATEGRLVAAMFDAEAAVFPGREDELHPPEGIVVAPLSPLNPITF